MTKSFRLRIRYLMSNIENVGKKSTLKYTFIHRKMFSNTNIMQKKYRNKLPVVMTFEQKL